MPTYILGTFYIRFFVTRATISLFRVKPTVQDEMATEMTRQAKTSQLDKRAAGSTR